jgi:hypothetical protein
MKSNMLVLLVLAGITAFWASFSVAQEVAAVDSMSVFEHFEQSHDPNSWSRRDDSKAAWIVDDFEDGDFDGWNVEGTASCTTYISSIAANGNYSMPTGVSFYVQSSSSTTHDSYFILGDADSGPGGNVGAIYFKGSPSGVWSVITGDGGHDCGPRNPNQWYQVGFVIDWPCKMYDVRIDGVPKLTNMTFNYADTDSFDKIHVYNWDSATALYDDIMFSTPGISPLIFEDNFERGSACRWTVVDS